MKSRHIFQNIWVTVGKLETVECHKGTLEVGGNICDVLQVLYCTVQYHGKNMFQGMSNFKALEGTANRVGLKVLSKLTCEWKLWS